MEQMAHRAAAHEIDKSKYVGIIWRPAEYGGDGRAQRTAVRRNYGQEFIALGHVGDNSQEESHSASVEQNVAHGVQCVARSTRRGLLRLTVGCFENRSEEHTSELQSLMRISYAVFCLKKKKKNRK